MLKLIRFYLLLTVSMIPLLASGQFGINADVLLSDNAGNEDITSVDYGSWEVGVNYWFRLKDIRIEFFPELIYRQHDLGSGMDNQTEWSFAAPIQFYLLDFVSDCECPTFSKQNDFMTKGLFVFVSPEIGLIDDANGSITNAKIGGGIGLDIGVSDLITITPILQYDYRFFESDDILTIPNGALKAGLRVSLRPDYKSF